jgi:hypothetical protein
VNISYLWILYHMLGQSGLSVFIIKPKATVLEYSEGVWNIMLPRHIASFVSDRKPLNSWNFQVHIKQTNSARSAARLATRYYNLRLSSKSVFLSPGSQLQSGRISQQDASACAMLADGSYPITTRPSTLLSYVIYISFSV